MPVVERKSYTRKSYTRHIPHSKKRVRVSGSKVKISTSGRSRGRKTKSAKFSKSKGFEPWIRREGKLGGPGFLDKTYLGQKRILGKCVADYGYRSCLGSVMVLMRNSNISDSEYNKLDRLKNYLKEKFGGKGSFGPRQ